MSDEMSSESGARMRAGSCGCGAIRYQVADEFLYAGSLLYSVVRDGSYLHGAMGSLVDAPAIRPTEHIYVGSKAPWFEISDGLPQAEELE